MNDGISHALNKICSLRESNDIELLEVYIGILLVLLTGCRPNEAVTMLLEGQIKKMSGCFVGYVLQN